MKVHKNKLKKIKRLIEDSMDSDITEIFDESMDCLYEAINELNSLIDD